MGNVENDPERLVLKVCDTASFRCVWRDACPCVSVRDRMNSLSLYLGGLRVLQPLGLVHVHEEVLQQPLSLSQVFCVRLLVDERLLLRITLRVLQGRHRNVVLVRF